MSADLEWAFLLADGDSVAVLGASEGLLDLIDNSGNWPQPLDATGWIEPAPPAGTWFWEGLIVADRYGDDAHAETRRIVACTLANVLAGEEPAEAALEVPAGKERAG